VALGIDLFMGDGYTVLSLTGQLDSTTAPQFRDAAIALLHTVTGRQHLVVIDGTALEFLDSTGMGVFIGIHRRLGVDGGGLLLANLFPAVARAVRLTGLDTVIPTHASEEASYPWHEPGATVSTIALALELPVRDGWVVPDGPRQSSPPVAELNDTFEPATGSDESDSHSDGLPNSDR
jgi:anti-sigma B factor antagonist